MTATSETPYLPPPSPQVQRSGTAHRSGDARTPSRPSSSPLKQRTPSRHQSPCKSRVIPSQQCSPARSPRRAHSLAKCSTNTEPVSFSPQKTRQPPRAWERRPATPYIPRDDKQKIWKRVPLGELGVEINRPVGSTRRAEAGRKDYVRVVKKLKVGHDSGEDDKENETVAIGVKVGCDEQGPKRSGKMMNNAHTSVSTKVEQDEILGSPKKKLRQPLVEMNACDERETEEIETIIDEPGEDHGSHVHVEQMDEDSATEETEADADATDDDIEAGDEQQNTANADDGPATIPRAGADELCAQLVLPSEEIVDDYLCGNEILDKEELLPEQFFQFEGNTAIGENRSSSPPTIIAENIMIDELAIKQSPLSDRIEAEDLGAVIEDQTVEFEARGPLNGQEDAPRRISDGEATFLRDFMSRTKAERVAREEKLRNMLKDQDDLVSNGILQVIPANMDNEISTGTALSPPRFELSATEQKEAAPSSPLRRSKRATVTSIPRPQNVPNAIQLKRANGNEFIFTANNSSSVANIAMTTRSNTKKNKGLSLNVHARLEQLLDEKPKERNNDAELEKPEDDTGEKAEIGTTSEKVTKKRKRDKKDNGNKPKKALRWNDANLVEYQEAERNEDWDDIEDGSQEDVDQEEDESSKHVKLTLIMTKNSEAVMAETDDTKDETQAQARKEEKAAASQSKVRRVRRGTSGSVNGTPAPKTRTRSMLGTEESVLDTKDLEVSMAETSNAASVAINELAAGEAKPQKTTRATTIKSRMPVPSLTRRGAAASARVRAAASSNLPTEAGITTVSASAKEKVTNNTSEVASTTSAEAKEEEKGDVLGWRRLRVRP